MGKSKGIQLDLTGLDDRAMQKVLRELDSVDMAAALKSAPSVVRQRVFRNVSKRAAALLRDDMSRMGPDGDARRALAVERVNRIIERLTQVGEIRRGRATAAAGRKSRTAVTIDLSDERSVRSSLLSIGRKAGSGGLLSLEADFDKLGDGFLRRGLQLVIDGTDPSLVERILRSELESYRQEQSIRIREAIMRMERELADEVTRRRMVLDGVLSIQAGDHPYMLARRIDSHLPS